MVVVCGGCNHVWVESRVTVINKKKLNGRGRNLFFTHN